MKKLVLVVMLLSLVGCASIGDVENIQHQLDVVKIDVDAAAKVAQETKAVSAKTNVTLAFTEKALLDAEQANILIGQKLDRLFKKRMEK